jgi:hypothetical protein
MLPDSTPTEFCKLASSMPTTLQRLLLDNAHPASISPDSLLDDLRGLMSHPHQASALQIQSHVMRQKGVLDAVDCLVLREAVDRYRTSIPSSIDGAADHQLDLNVHNLKSLLSVARVRELFLLAAEFRRASGVPTQDVVQQQQQRRRVEGIEKELEEPITIFLRRYSADTRPWNPFHNDAAAVTVNVALSADSQHGGGRLLALTDGALTAIERAEGEATIHDSQERAVADMCHRGATASAQGSVHCWCRT